MSRPVRMWIHALPLAVVVALGCGGDDGDDTADDGDSTSSETDSAGDGDGDPDGCHPLEADCADGEGCYPQQGDTFECEPEGSAEHGAKCDSSNDCMDGLYCAAKITLVDCKQPKCCTSFCDLDAPDCLDGEFCAVFFQDEVPGYENLGVCRSN